MLVPLEYQITMDLVGADHHIVTQADLGHALQLLAPDSDCHRVPFNEKSPRPCPVEGSSLSSKITPGSNTPRHMTSGSLP